MPEETLLLYHTLHVPHQSADLGMWENDPFLPQHVAQLNAAGRHVAQSLHFHVIDIEAMAAQVSKGTLLVDNTHPGPDFMMQARSACYFPLSLHNSLPYCAAYGTAGCGKLPHCVVPARQCLRQEGRIKPHRCPKERRS